jgi:hypothetical protein
MKEGGLRGKGPKAMTAMLRRKKASPKVTMSPYSSLRSVASS